MKQAYRQHALQPLDLLAKSGLGDPQSMSGPSEVQLLGKDDECAQVS
jgi:hypothetical protein